MPNKVTNAHTPAALIELQAHPNWVCWRREERNGKTTKIPYNAHTGSRAKSDDATTWASYEVALNALQRHADTYDGLGYMFDGTITGIDLDHCIDEHGEIDAWAQAYLDRLNGYSEKSPNEEGIHVLVHGSLPGHKGTRRMLKGMRHPDAAIEMYDQGRYFTITGKHLDGTPETLQTRQEALDAVYASLVPSTKETVLGNAPGRAGLAGSLHNTPTPTLITDADLLKKAETAANGGKFTDLYTHGMLGNKSASEADLALCAMLAFWTGKDTARIDRLFRGSALYRDKWDERRGAATYGERTIAKALTCCDVVYDPQRTKHQLEQDIEHLLVQIATQQRVLCNVPARGRKPYQITPKDVATRQVLLYLDQNEWGDALYFADVFGGQVIYDHSEKEWYLWNGHAWRKDSTGKVRQLTAGVLGSLYLKAAADLTVEQVELEQHIQTVQQETRESKDAVSLIDGLKLKLKVVLGHISDLHTRAKNLRTTKRTVNVLAYVQSLMGVTSDMWDRDQWLLAVPNGVVDLHTGTRRDGDPGDYIRTVCPTDWTSLDAACPRFEQFLAEVFEDKQDRAAITAFLHRLFGYGITGSTQDHVFPILYGEEGRNGKDTLLGILADVLGPIAGAISNDVFIAQDKLKTGGAATPHLSDLQGKRLVWGSETRQGDKLNVALIKQLSGGGDISTRPLYAKDYYTFKPTHKLLLMTNYKPHVDAKDKAAWERVCLIDFGMRFVDNPRATNERKKDATLGNKLKEERSGILAWLVRGCLAWQQQGLAVPESVRLATSQYRDEEDRILLFIQECCYVSPSAWVKARDLYTAYAKWIEASQFGRPMNIRLFGDDMSKRFEKVRTNVANIYQGVGLLTLDQEPDPQANADTVYGESQPYTTPEPASEANVQHMNVFSSVGSVDRFPKVPINELYPPSIEEDNGKVPTHSTPISSVNTSHATPQANADTVYGESQPSTNYTPTLHDHPCTTKWEKFYKVAHKAAATRLSVGLWWCERCERQRLLMECGDRLQFPELKIATYRVQAGQDKWLRLAQEAGDERVHSALEQARCFEQTGKDVSHE